MVSPNGKFIVHSLYLWLEFDGIINTDFEIIWLTHNFTKDKSIFVASEKK